MERREVSPTADALSFGEYFNFEATLITNDGLISIFFKFNQSLIIIFADFFFSSWLNPAFSQFVALHISVLRNKGGEDNFEHCHIK